MSVTKFAQNKLEGVQVLRGVAALLVLWCHLKFNLGRDAENFSNVPFLATNFGSIGVDIFFVISGFVISMTAAKLGTDWRAFLALRVARVVPLYFAASTYVLLESILSSHLGDKPMRISGLSIFNTYAFIPVLDGRYFTGPILVNGWTLSFEVWFYLCFAGLLRLGAARQGWLWLPLFFTVGMILNLAFTQHGPWYLPKFLFHPMTLEFCAGCVLYHLRDRIGKFALYAMAGLCLLFLFWGYHESFLGVHWTILDDARAGLYRVMVWGGFAACLVGVITQIDLKYTWKWPQFLLLLGDASYSIYLVPMPPLMMTFSILLKLLGKFMGHDMTPPPWYYGSIYVLGSVAVSIACWKFFEIPTTSLTKRWLFRFLPERQRKPNTPDDPIPKIGESANPS
jgi:exopolysaccharide production protein ExoZ